MTLAEAAEAIGSGIWLQKQAIRQGFAQICAEWAATRKLEFTDREVTTRIEITRPDG